ncbi:unnamed protein product [Alopecurus aequalis]
MPPPPPTTPEPEPTLPDELIEEVFLRLPPDEPAWLVRASLASKLWLGLLTGPAFHGRYREFHGAPPMLGLFYSAHPCQRFLGEKPDPLFVSTTGFRASIPNNTHWGWESDGCYPLDCRHGRVALGHKYSPLMPLAVLDPVAGCCWDTGPPPCHYSYGAAVLCAVTGCDHLACHDDTFRVVYVGLNMNLNGGTTASVWISSSQTGDCSDPSSKFHLGGWSQACSGFHIEADPFIKNACPVLVKDALHFMLLDTDDGDDGEDCWPGILSYDLSSDCLSRIDAPLDVVDTSTATILMALEDGSLGFAYVDGLTLKIRLKLIGSVDGCDIIFVTTDLGIYKINLRTLQWKKLWNREIFLSLVPYMSFYNPKERVRPCEVTH